MIESSTTVATITLDPDYEYELTHLGLKADGATGATDAIMLAVGSATPAATTGLDKMILTSTATLRIGPGVDTLKYDAVASTPAFNITANTFRGGER